MNAKHTRINVCKAALSLTHTYNGMQASANLLGSGCLRVTETEAFLSPELVPGQS